MPARGATLAFEVSTAGASVAAAPSRLVEEDAGAARVGTMKGAIAAMAVVESLKCILICFGGLWEMMSMVRRY